VEEEIERVKPDRLVSFIGRTSGPGFTTIDYLEQKGKLMENVRDNLYGPMVLALMAVKYNIHFTYLGTGCIFYGYPENGYTEEDSPDFFGSSYSTVKGFTDRLMHFMNNNVLNLRIRMPITSDNSPKNFITKMMTYKKICSIPNSMTVLPELLPIMADLIARGFTGTINFTNPGLISHNEILEMLKEILDPSITWENFSEEEQSKIILAGRSNNLLNTDKLQSLYPSITPIKDAVRRTIMEMKVKLNHLHC
jgi:3,5-epimerase/4-reductase